MNVPDYCAKKIAVENNLETPDQQALLVEACKSFVESDRISKAYDSWYNSLSRNYVKQAKAENPGNTQFYHHLETLTSNTPVTLETEVKLVKMNNLAPSVLIDNGMESPGVSHSVEKLTEFRNYNTLSFEGGGSSIEYNWKAASDDTTNGADFGAYNKEHTFDDTSSEKGAAGLAVDATIQVGNGVLGHVKLELQVGGGGSHVGVKTTVVTATDTSHAKFHLEDPNFGDYFVVTVWRDPEYPTPIFSLQGGASSCKWEANTYHKSAPTVKVDYVGPDQIPPDQPALFKMNLGNEVNYYEGGIAGGKLRPGWVTLDDSYAADMPTFALAILSTSLDDGLQISTNGQPFSYNELMFNYFGKRSKEVLVEIRRGHLQYEYLAPQATFGEKCSIAEEAWPGIGEQAALSTLGMATNKQGKRVVTFMQPCPAVAWSGKILQDGTFNVHSSDGARSKVELMVLNPIGGIWPTDQNFKGLQFQYRAFDSDSVATPDWRTISPEPLIAPSSADGYPGYIRGAWQPGAVPDGVYKVRINTLCIAPTAPEEYQQSSTPIIRGVIDRTAPAVVSAQSSSNAASLSSYDTITVTFTEPILCSGHNPRSGEGGAVQATFVLSTGGTLQHVCDGTTVLLSLESAPGNTQAGPVTLTIAGIVDVAGNGIEQITVDVAQNAMNEKLDKMNATVDIAHSNHEVQLAAMDTKLSAMETANKNQLDVIEAILVTFAGDAADAVLKAEQARAELLTVTKDAADAAAQQLQVEQDAAESATLAKEEATEAALNAEQALEALKASDNVSDDEIDAAAAAVEAAEATLVFAVEQEAAAKVNVAAAKDVADTAAAAAISAASTSSDLSGTDVELSNGDSQRLLPIILTFVLIGVVLLMVLLYVTTNSNAANDAEDNSHRLSRRLTPTRDRAWGSIPNSASGLTNDNYAGVVIVEENNGSSLAAGNADTEEELYGGPAGVAVSPPGRVDSQASYSQASYAMASASDAPDPTLSSSLYLQPRGLSIRSKGEAGQLNSGSQDQLHTSLARRASVMSNV
jgi:hypothetical protein